jgi:hypothetical protein
LDNLSLPNSFRADAPPFGQFQESSQKVANSNHGQDVKEVIPMVVNSIVNHMVVRVKLISYEKGIWVQEHHKAIFD